MAKFFSDREIRAVAVFLPLAGLLIGGIVLLRPKADPQAAFVAGMEMEGRADSPLYRTNYEHRKGLLEALNNIRKL